MLEGLLFDEARAIISSLDSEKLAHWWAWRDDWADWRPACEVEGLSEMIFRGLNTKPPELPQEVYKSEKLLDPSEVAPQGFTMAASVQKNDDELQISNVTFTLRAKRRFNKRLSVTIEHDQNVFKTFTKDVSVGGVQLEDPLPDWLSGDFKVRLGKPGSKTQIELACTIIENNNFDRRRIKILPLQKIEDEKALEAWIAA